MFDDNYGAWDINSMFHDVIECLTAALEAKDLYTSGHSLRVADMSYYLAKKVGLQGLELETVHIAAHLHDIGKIGVPEQILNKEDALLPQEWEQIKKHPEIGYNILNKSRHLRAFAGIVLHHHERWDGRGYPGKLKGRQIPLGSRIIAVCDTIDAMTSNRPYRTAFSLEETLQEIRLNQGIQFDPELVEATESLWSTFEKEYNKKNIRLINHPQIEADFERTDLQTGIEAGKIFHS